MFKPIILAGVFCCSPLLWANTPADPGQQRVAVAIEAWNACLRSELNQQIQNIASPALIADTVLNLCNAPYLRLQQLMIDDMSSRDSTRDPAALQRSVVDSLQDAQDNHRAKIISIVLKYRAK
jgi:hypothetical protein